MADYLWLFVLAGGPALIGFAVAYVLMTRRRLQPRERRDEREGLEDLYGP